MTGEGQQQEVAALVTAFRTGSSEGTAALYRRYGRLVYVVAKRVLGDDGLAEDATQQTITLSGISAGGGESQALVVTASSMPFA